MTLKVVMALAYTVTVPAVVGTVTLLRKRGDHAITILSILFISSFLFELLATYSRILYHNNLIVLNIASIVEGWIILFFISNELEGQVKRRDQYILFPIVPYLFTAVAVAEYLAIGVSFFNYSYTIKNTFIIVGLLYICWQIAYGMNIHRWKLYILAVFLFYYIANFIFFLTVSPKMNIDILMFSYDIHNIINALINLFFGLALWKLSHTKASLLDSSY